MVLSLAERARLVLRFLMGQTKKTQAEIAGELGYGNATVLSQYLNGKKKMPKDLPARIAALDPCINVNFLTGDSDEMLLYDASQGTEMPQESTNTVPVDESPDKQPFRPENGIFVPGELVQMISDMSATIKDQQKIITTLVETWAKRQ